MAERKTGEEKKTLVTKETLERTSTRRTYSGQQVIDQEGYLPNWRNIEEEHEAIYEDWKYKCEVIKTQHELIEHAARVLHSIFSDEDRGLLGPEATILQKINDYIKTERNEL